MANIVIIGGGFAGMVAAESLAGRLDAHHQITLVSRGHQFLFYPALVRLAFRQCDESAIEFDVREALRDHKVRFVTGEVARLHPEKREITFARGDFVGEMPYDYLVLAVGRRLRTEQITGFYEHAHHVLDARNAKKFGDAARQFTKGHAVIGACPGARLPVPVFETAFALSRLVEAAGNRDHCTITIASCESTDEMFGGIPLSESLTGELKLHRIEMVSDFAITQVTQNKIIAEDGRALAYDLNMLVPPFCGPGLMMHTGLTDAEGYVRVEKTMRVERADRIYAAGDCVNLFGPKMAHMAVGQAEVAAENLAAEIEKQPADTNYEHELMLVIDGYDDAIFAHKNFSSDAPAHIQHSRFWSWAKQIQQRYWTARHI